jgi:hypothetical protein
MASEPIAGMFFSFRREEEKEAEFPELQMSFPALQRLTPPSWTLNSPSWSLSKRRSSSNRRAEFQVITRAATCLFG